MLKTHVKTKEEKMNDLQLKEAIIVDDNTLEKEGKSTKEETRENKEVGIVTETHSEKDTVNVININTTTRTGQPRGTMMTEIIDGCIRDRRRSRMTGIFEVCRRLEELTGPTSQTRLNRGNKTIESQRPHRGTMLADKATDLVNADAMGQPSRTESILTMTTAMIIE